MAKRKRPRLRPYSAPLHEVRLTKREMENLTALLSRCLMGNWEAAKSFIQYPWNEDRHRIERALSALRDRVMGRK